MHLGAVKLTVLSLIVYSKMMFSLNRWSVGVFLCLLQVLLPERSLASDLDESRVRMCGKKLSDLTIQLCNLVGGLNQRVQRRSERGESLNESFKRRIIASQPLHLRSFSMQTYVRNISLALAVWKPRQRPRTLSSTNLIPEYCAWWSLQWASWSIYQVRRLHHAEDAVQMRTLRAVANFRDLLPLSSDGAITYLRPHEYFAAVYHLR